MSDTPKTQPEALPQQQQPAPPAVLSSLPPQLNDFKNCFIASKKSFLSAFADAAKGERTFNREVNFAAQAMVANNYLITCARQDPNALIDAIKNIALTGLTLNPVLKLGYLVPFKGKITFMASYQGLVDIMINSGIARKVEAHAVFTNDLFEVSFGTEGHIIHKPDPWGRRDINTFVGCYYLILLADGTEIYDTLSKDEIDAIKQRSPSVEKGKQSPWDTDYIEMAKKTAVRRGFKMCPKSNISESKLNAIEATFDYDEKVERDWIEKQNKPKDDNWDNDEVDYEEVDS